MSISDKRSCVSCPVWFMCWCRKRLVCAWFWRLALMFCFLDAVMSLVLGSLTTFLLFFLLAAVVPAYFFYTLHHHHCRRRRAILITGCFEPPGLHVLWTRPAGDVLLLNSALTVCVCVLCLDKWPLSSAVRVRVSVPAWRDAGLHRGSAPCAAFLGWPYLRYQKWNPGMSSFPHHPASVLFVVEGKRYPVCDISNGLVISYKWQYSIYTLLLSRYPPSVLLRLSQSCTVLCKTLSTLFYFSTNLEFDEFYIIESVQNKF